VLSTISREAAAEAYRKCLFLDDSDDVEDCLDDTLAEIQDFAEAVLPNAGVILTIYEYEDSVVEFDVQEYAKSEFGGFSSYFEEADFDDFDVAAFSNNKRFAAVAEAIYDYSQPHFAIAAVIGFFTATEFRETTIF